VQFDAALNGSTITLTTGQLDITKPMTIMGPGAGLLAISGNGQSRIFDVYTGDGSSVVAISGLTLSHGDGGSFSGGAVDVTKSKVTLNKMVLSANTAVHGGGLFAAAGAYVIVYDSVLTGNSAMFGGGVAAGGSVLYLTRTTISGNTASRYGGGIDIYS